ncbi:pro-sigmaK processing inhibitor BofA family protein [Miniphocaeibacter halophilus]|uniref:Pro-sigmaK processing inhibitor BofA family protein n=1 Tax=Miniphocaeibacter halophilus TaxID=2931922 RepID=A0AC61MQZ2_9FIRM|nr:pro-sigmaK processing inhibitor BofA family protein [Miniphocaeibacter halophilus]QQK08004.1 pro-sigmaK processing inhibitor BofA family protein [Miniphocaeibacter halophilus]
MDKIIEICIIIALIFVFFKLIKTSIKFFGKIIINGIIGVVSLFIFNAIGGIIGLNLAITPINAIISGIFGIPGIIVLLFINA